jgi:hypothetical protein
MIQLGLLEGTRSALKSHAMSAMLAAIALKGTGADPA